MNHPLPYALRIWNNAARLSLPWKLKLWLTVLVVTFLSSTAFIAPYTSPRWVLGGFIVSHLIVFYLSAWPKFVLRIGMVSLLHVLCWAPGYVMMLADRQGHATNLLYAFWSHAIIIVISIAFIFDLRDACSYLRYAIRGKLSISYESSTGQEISQIVPPSDKVSRRNCPAKR